MTTRIRRAVVAVALALLMATVLTGVAWAVNVIQCAPGTDALHPCEGTGKDDVMYGTKEADRIGGGHRGADTLYGRGGDDELIGGVGPDKVYGGPGDDDLTNQETDYPFGKDENHGGATIPSTATSAPSTTSAGGAMTTSQTIRQAAGTRTTFVVAPVAMSPTTTRASIRSRTTARS